MPCHLLTATYQFYLCGASRISLAVKEKLVAIIQEARGGDAADAAAAFSELIVGRFATDVFE